MSLKPQRVFIWVLCLFFSVGCGRLRSGKTNIGDPSDGQVCTMEARSGLGIKINKASWAQGQTPDGLRIIVIGPSPEEMRWDDSTSKPIIGADGFFWNGTAMEFDSNTGVVRASAAYESPGTYNITIIYGSTTKSASAVVESTPDLCHVVGVAVDFTIP